MVPYNEQDDIQWSEYIYVQCMSECARPDVRIHVHIGLHCIRMDLSVWVNFYFFNIYSFIA